MFPYNISFAPLELKPVIIRDPLVVSPTMTVIDAISTMGRVPSYCSTASGACDPIDTLAVRSSCVLVVESGWVLGILTERDVVRLTAQQHWHPSIEVRQVMTQPVITLQEKALTDIFFAINLLQQHQIRHLPILDEQGGLVGLVTHESLRRSSHPMDLLRLRQASETMTRDVICASRKTPVLTIAQLMVQHQVSSVVITETLDQGPFSEATELAHIPVGIFTERDVVKLQSQGGIPETLTAEVTMSAPVVSVCSDDSLLVVQQVMASHCVRRVVVTGEHHELLGIVTQTSLIKAINPLALYNLVEGLEQKVLHLEAEKVALLESRTAELEQQVEARTAEIRAKTEQDLLVSKITTQIRASLSLEAILNTTVQQLRQVLHCERVTIWKFGTDWAMVGIAESTDSPLSLIGQRFQNTGQPAYTDIYPSGYIRVVSDVNTVDNRGEFYYEMLMHLQIRATLLVPVFCGDQLWGLLLASEGQQVRDWKVEEVNLLRALSEQLAIAIQQAITHEQLQRELVKRQQIEILLKKSDQRFGSLVEFAPVGIFRTDANGHCTFVNRRWCEIAGLTPQEAAGEGWQKSLHPEDQEKIGAEWYASAQENRPFQLEYRFRRPDGIVTWVKGQSVAAERDSTGQVTGYVGTITDITDRKRVEWALQETEAKYRNIYDHAVEGIYQSTPEGLFLMVNPALARICGYESPDAMVQAFEDIGQQLYVKPQRRTEFQQILVKQDRITGFESEVYCRDGSTLWVSETGRLVRDDQGQPSYYEGTASDISDRKRAEMALQNLIEGTAATTGQDFFPALTSHIAKALTVSYALVTELIDDHLHVLAFWANGTLQPTFSFPLSQTPCQRSLQSGQFACSTSVQEMFPQHPDLAEMAAESYVGIALRDSQGQAIGNLCILDQKPLTETERVEKLLSVFAARASAELERQRATRQLHELNQALESKVEERTVKLQESQQFLQTVLDTFPLSVFWKDRNSVYLGCNRNFLKDADYSTVSDLIGKTDYDMPWGKTEAEPYRLDDHIVMASDTAKLQIIEPQKQANGEQIWVETNKLPLHTLDGEVMGVLGTYQNITARKQAEQAMKQQLAAIEAVIDGIAILQGGRYLYVNQAHLNLFGYGTPDELLGQSWEILYSKSEVARFERQIFPTLERDRAWQGEATGKRRDGTQFMEGLSFTLMDDGLLICVCRDVSHRKRVEAELRQLSARLDLAVESAAIGIWDWDLTQNRLIWDKRMYELYDVTPGQFSNAYEAWVNGLHPDDRAMAETLSQKVLRGETGYDTEFRIIHPDGSVRFIKANALVQRNAQGEPQRMIGLNYDITDQKKIQGQLQQTNEELIRATRLKDEFLANMSHELRTPLNAILGITEGLQDKVFGELTPQQHNAIKMVERSGAHLLELINDILDVAKIESGQIELNLVSTAIFPLCQSSLAFIKQQAHKKRIYIEIRQPFQLPDLLIDQRRMKQVLINLLNNAVKFTPEGGRVTLELTVQPDSTPSPQASVIEGIEEDETNFAYVQIAIRDTGIGIAPEHLKKLFQPFIQIDSALNRKYNGTGLGLALVKRIVDLHQGQVGVTSEVGVGSCFTVKLPYPKELPLPAEPKEQVVLASMTTQQVDPTMAPLILLAEDNEINIVTISSYLTAKGYRLLVAKSGEEALILTEAEHPDLILMDIQMPKMDGLEAIHRIRLDLNRTDIPIIALTALAMTGDRERCLAAGANDYMSKPVKLRALWESIQTWLQQSPKRNRP